MERPPGVIYSFHKVHSAWEHRDLIGMSKDIKHYYNIPHSQSKAMKKLKKLLNTGTEIEFFNVWRPLTVVKSHPLAVCSWSSVDPENDPWGVELDGARFQMASGQDWKANPQHKWYYLSDQDPQEVYVLRQGKTPGNGGRGIHVPHTAFHPPGKAEDAPPLYSYEISVAVIMKAKSDNILMSFISQAKRLFMQCVDFFHSKMKGYQKIPA